MKHQPDGKTVAILTDVTKCIGCRDCVVACKQTYNLDKDVPRRWSNDDGLSSRNWTSIIERENNTFVRKQCRHCLEPACVAACPVGALQISDEGPVIYDSKKCMGCRYCMLVCPYGIPRYDWDLAVPFVRKCIMCFPRLQEGKQPACTEACPVEATIFGTRDELLAEAHRRIKAEPDKYINKVWGEDEIGGSRVLYISNVDLSFLTYGKNYDNKSVPSLARPAMNAVLPTFATMAGTMAGVGWIINRRMKNMQTDELEENQDNSSSAVSSDEGDSNNG
ncbi:MAG: 4Fe-4S dicluster domain-containing protein [Candidatus Electryonea clarkiae]|nr:4Fe-4S dicluster domain-containing protein [Candidatus Electryonea clarkiae]MDP8285263.1 4Fe-4S dicluster domain-containing protein [Candidatus Electryonea clarkiae]